VLRCSQVVQLIIHIHRRTRVGRGRFANRPYGCSCRAAKCPKGKMGSDIGAAGALLL